LLKRISRILHVLLRAAPPLLQVVPPAFANLAGPPCSSRGDSRRHGHAPNMGGWGRQLLPSTKTIATTDDRSCYK
jgi:hypothetical protein